MLLTIMLGKKMTRTLKKKKMSNKLFNGEVLPGGVPGPQRGRSRKSMSGPY